MIVNNQFHLINLFTDNVKFILVTAMSLRKSGREQ